MLTSVQHPVKRRFTCSGAVNCFRCSAVTGNAWDTRHGRLDTVFRAAGGRMSTAGQLQVEGALQHGSAVTVRSEWALAWRRQR